MIYFMNFSIFFFVICFVSSHRTVHITKNPVDPNDSWLKNFSLSTPKGLHFEWIYFLSMPKTYDIVDIGVEWLAHDENPNQVPLLLLPIQAIEHYPTAWWILFISMDTYSSIPNHRPKTLLIYYENPLVWLFLVFELFMQWLASKMVGNLIWIPPLCVLYSMKPHKYILLRISMFCGHNCKPCATLTMKKRTYESSQHRTKSIFLGNKNNMYAKIKAIFSISLAL